MRLVASRIANAGREKTVQNPGANLGSTKMELSLRQAVAKAAAHPEIPLESNITHSEILGLIPDEKAPDKFRKRNIDPKKRYNQPTLG